MDLEGPEFSNKNPPVDNQTGGYISGSAFLTLVIHRHRSKRFPICIGSTRGHSANFPIGRHGYGSVERNFTALPPG